MLASQEEIIKYYYYKIAFEQYTPNVVDKKYYLV